MRGGPLTPLETAGIAAAIAVLLAITLSMFGECHGCYIGRYCGPGVELVATFQIAALVVLVKEGVPENLPLWVKHKKAAWKKIRKLEDEARVAFLAKGMYPQVDEHDWECSYKIIPRAPGAPLPHEASELERELSYAERSPNEQWYVLTVECFFEAAYVLGAGAGSEHERARFYVYEEYAPHARRRSMAARRSERSVEEHATGNN